MNQRTAATKTLVNMIANDAAVTFAEHGQALHDDNGDFNASVLAGLLQAAAISVMLQSGRQMPDVVRMLREGLDRLENT